MGMGMGMGGQTNVIVEERRGVFGREHETVIVEHNNGMGMGMGFQQERW